eukprot:Ihof_evm5s206 gene=Ihof_evmTU5s206
MLDSTYNNARRSMSQNSIRRLFMEGQEGFEMEYTPGISRPGMGSTSAVLTEAREPETKITLSLREAFLQQEWLAIIIVLLLVLFPAALCDKFLTQPRHRFFMSTDATISYPGPNEDSFDTLYFVLTYFLIIIIIAVFEFTISRHSGTNRYFAFYSFLYYALDLGMCISVAVALTVYLKYYVGRLRPDFLSRCVLPEGPINKISTFYAGTSTEMCLNQDAILLKKGRLSYPSGHTSMAFCQGFYLFFYVLWALYIRPQDQRRTDRRMERNRFAEQLVEILRGMALFIGPTFSLFVGASRLVDYKHHPSDVNAGALLGIICSTVMCVKGVAHYTRRVSNMRAY